ncbi:peptidoglycan D,D-transpeptidase FtsI family protein [Aquicella lusitana]|uniref:Peptidoglycan D,D-transpeptidase FtsI n=1 Tax=Aquicella lusitana TaxID=254246 RepID=A0A370GM77_9COXI|nr:penicillin-binding transpeptidase domain-containing protein [Aquicella lusitana]RDI44771.1 peptidoglycan synthetase FtsI [Aquicella lusitana]VVC72968.1 Peptidoglycan synthase FtsI [Aquicella lusitana]
MNQKHRVSFITWRFYLVISVIVLAVLGLLWRVFDLAVLDQHFLRHQGDERVLRLVSTPAFRGMILDRNNFPLAVSTIVYSVWMNPQEFEPSKEELVSLSAALGLKIKDIVSLRDRQRKKRREFVYLKRALSPQVANEIKALDIPGVYLQQEYRRYYPEGEVTAHVLGFTNIDDQGQEGLELGYNQWLSGEPGKKWVIKDRLGRIIADVQTVQEQKRGHDLVLSIDRRIQYLAYRELLAGVIRNEAVSGSVIVLDVKTGEILAMVNHPSFNPNNRPARMSDRFRNRAVTDLFEPGSTVKAFSVASALDSGHYKTDTVIDTSPGWMRVSRNVVKDHNNNGSLTVTQILQKSSNVGIAKLVLSLPPDNLWSLLHSVGFGEMTGIGFPGEQNGVLVKHNPWGAFTLATLAIGYGMSTTALQLARSYAVLANEGIKKPVSLLRIDKPVTGEQVMNPKVVKEVLEALESVLGKGGTAEDARVPGYRVAGKTGTSKIAGEGGYKEKRYTSSFVGIAPLSNPRLVVAVVIHDPQGKHYYGGQVSGPVFEKIMEGALRILDIPPDAPESALATA